MNNISFQGRTYLALDSNLYDKTRSVTKSAYRHLSSSNNCRLTNGKTFTSEINEKELAVIVRNEKDGFIKIVPFSSKIETILDDIAAKIQELQRSSKEKLTAWIIGGENFSAPNCKTIEKINQIADVLCDKPNIDTSILAGSTTGNEKVVLHTLNNKLELTLDKPASNKSLEDYYDLVEINNTTIV